ncbi:Maf1 regulator-domain-containing protein, partial [Phakopsora pachyrhizi]
LGLLASTLSSSTQSVRVTTRIEAYSCKPVSSERKLFKSLDQEFASDLELSHSTSPSALSESASGCILKSAFGPLDRKGSRKTFWLLIATLNAAYPDHSFSHVKVENFYKEESMREVLLKMSEALELEGPCSTFPSSLGALSISPGSLIDRTGDCSRNQASESLVGVHPVLIQVLDPVIDLSQCEVYSYCPDPDSDPHAVDSDEEEDEVESLASSFYGNNKAFDVIDSPYGGEEETMWPMDDVDASTYPETFEDDPLTLNRTSAVMSAQPTTASDQSSSSVIGTQIGKQISQGIKCRKPITMHPVEARSSVRKNSAVHQSLSDLDVCADLEEGSAGGLLWSSHYFFYNKKMKRILFISTWGRKHLGGTSYNDSSNLQSEQQSIDHLLKENSYSAYDNVSRPKLLPIVSSYGTKKKSSVRVFSGRSDLSGSCNNSENKRRLSFPEPSNNFDSSFETDCSEVNTNDEPVAKEGPIEHRSDGDDPIRPNKRIRASSVRKS